jgi:hypothetical protein
MLTFPQLCVPDKSFVGSKQRMNQSCDPMSPRAMPKIDTQEGQERDGKQMPPSDPLSACGKGVRVTRRRSVQGMKAIPQ